MAQMRLALLTAAVTMSLAGLAPAADAPVLTGRVKLNRRLFRQ